MKKFLLYYHKALQVLFRAEYLFSTILVFIVIGVLVVMPNLSFVNPFMQAFADFEMSDIVFSQLRSEAAQTADTSIVIVNIGNLGRAEITRQIERVAAHHPAAIGLDMFFRQPKNSHDDSLLVLALSKVKNLVMVTKLTQFNEVRETFDSLETSHPMFVQGANFGFANVIVDSLSGFRTVRLCTAKERAYDSTALAFSVQLAKIINPEAAQRFIDRNNDTEVINYRGNYSRYYTFDAFDVLNSEINLEVVRGKIVLFGFMGHSLAEPSLEDVFFTPLNVRNIGKTLPDMYGIVIHANIISMIVHGNTIDTMPQWMSFLVAFVVCYLNMVLFHYLQERYQQLYQPLSVFIQLAEWLLLITLLIWFLETFSIKANFTLALTACALSAGMFEIYSQSVQPFVLKIRQSMIFRYRR